MVITEVFAKSRKICDADSISYPDAALLIDTNANIETLIAKIHKVCPTFDDKNFGNIAEGFFALSEGVSKYTITDEFLNILGIKIKDLNGYFQIVNPLPQKETDNVLETLEANTGLPMTYRLLGRTFFFQPAPTALVVTLTDTSTGAETGGAKISYTRSSYQITSSDVSTGTLIIGIASPWHITICRMNAIEYCRNYKPDRVPGLIKQVDDDIYGDTGLLNHYASLQKDKRDIMSFATRPYK